MVEQNDRTLLGHPIGLYTLFFTELWERFSFYGMKALLILYMVNYLFWRQAEASQVFAWYAGLVYATPILGGIVADKWLGARWSVFIGGVIIAMGHFLLAFEPMVFFYSGLGFLVVGTGLLKPNISTQVGALYRSNDDRRDSAFTLFYMGINIGAFLGPLLCEYLRLNYSYHYGFAAAGVGMIVGQFVYVFGMNGVVRRERLVRAQEEELAREQKSKSSASAGGEPVLEERGGQSSPDMKRVYFDRGVVLVVICVFAILFWVGFEQAANVMNLWADQNTNTYVFRAESPTAPLPGEAAPSEGGLADWQIGAAMTQSINPMFIIALALVFAWLWQFLHKHNMEPSTPLKMALGVFFLSLAYGIMLLAAAAENRPCSAPLGQVPPGVDLNEFGKTRLQWEDGTLRMHGVLSEIDWLRALGASSSPGYQDSVTRLIAEADEKADEVREGRRTGELAGESAWEVAIEVPIEVGSLTPIAGWPLHTVGEQELPKIEWNAATRALASTDTLNSRDEAQLLAAGAEPAFRDALTAIYQESSRFKVSIGWLLAFYLVLTIGELCISPVGLSLVTKAAHPKYVGLFMGLWFFCTGFIANFAAHTVGGYWGMMTPTVYFMIFGAIGVIATVIMLLMLKVLKPLLHGIH